MSICSLKTSGSQPPLRKNPHFLQGPWFLFAYLLTFLHLLFPRVLIGRLWVAPSQGSLPNMPHPFACSLVRAIGHRMSSCHVFCSHEEEISSPEILQYAKYIFAVKTLLTQQSNAIFGFIKCNYQTTGEQKRTLYLLLAQKV